MACKWNCADCYRANEKATAIYNLNQIVNTINNDGNYGKLRSHLGLLKTYVKLFMKCENLEEVISNIDQLDNDLIEIKNIVIPRIQSRIASLNDEKIRYENAAATFHAEKEKEENAAYEEYLATQTPVS